MIVVFAFLSRCVYQAMHEELSCEFDTCEFDIDVSAVNSQIRELKFDDTNIEKVESYDEEYALSLAYKSLKLFVPMSIPEGVADIAEDMSHCALCDVVRRVT
jgi:hypothetical protein